MELEILRSELLEAYVQAFPQGLEERFSALKDAELLIPGFSFIAPFVLANHDPRGINLFGQLVLRLVCKKC